MSLINDMLKNLEKRETTNRNIPSIALTSTMHGQENSNLQKKIFIYSLIISIIVMMFVVTFLLRNSNPASPIQLPKNENIVTQPSPIKNEDADWLEPVTVTGVTLQIKENITEITFLLNHPALYRLSTNGMLNQLSLVLDKSTLQSELPAISYLNTGIERITSKNLNGDTRFDLSLIPGAILKYVNLSNENKNPELVVAIEYLPIDSESKDSQSTKAIKTPAMNSMLTQQYQSALNAAEGGQYQSAIDTLSQLLKADPSYRDARVSLAALLIDQGRQLSKATRVINDGLTLSPEYIPFVELKARIMTIEGKIKPALTMLQNLSPPIEENPEYHAFIAALYERSNNNQLASKIYKQLIHVNPHNGSWWFGLGVSLERLGERKQATDAYNKAMTEGHLSSESIAYLQKRLQVLEGPSDAKE